QQDLCLDAIARSTPGEVHEQALFIAGHFREWTRPKLELRAFAPGWLPFIQRLVWRIQKEEANVFPLVARPQVVISSRPVEGGHGESFFDEARQTSGPT